MDQVSGMITVRVTLIETGTTEVIDVSKRSLVANELRKALVFVDEFAGRRYELVQ